MASGSPADPPPPSAPASGGPREEWREWRREVRHYYRGGWGRTGSWGVALIVVGAYFLLKDVGLLDWVRGDVLWPALLIGCGVWLLAERMVHQPPRG